MSDSNIEPLARAICERMCAERKMTAAETAAWVDRHWESAAAEIEAGVIDEMGNRIPGVSWKRGVEAFIERIAASRKA